MNRRWILTTWGVALTGCLGVAASPGQDSSDLPNVASIFREVARIRQLPQHAQPPVKFPPGFTWSAQAGVELADSGHDATTSLRITLSQYFPGATEQILLGVSRAMVRAVGYSNVVPFGDPYAAKTELGDAMAQDFEHAGTIYGGRVVAVPLCHGEMMLSVVQTWSDTSSARKLKWAVATLQETAFSTYCERLTR